MPIDPHAVESTDPQSRVGGHLADVYRRLDAAERQIQRMGEYKIALPMGAGWGAYSAGGTPWEVATYSRVGRLVLLQGLVSKTGGTPVIGDVIGTLPVGFRPSGDLLMIAHTGATASLGRVNVLAASGNLTWGGGNTTEQDYTSLSGIIFARA